MRNACSGANSIPITIVERVMKLWPFKLARMNEVQHQNKIERFTPEDISAQVLRKVREIAADVKHAVIAMPALFDDFNPPSISKLVRSSALSNFYFAYCFQSVPVESSLEWNNYQLRMFVKMLRDL